MAHFKRHKDRRVSRVQPIFEELCLRCGNIKEPTGACPMCKQTDEARSERTFARAWAKAVAR